MGLDIFNKRTIAQKFCSKVMKLAKKYDLPFFIVTDGASAYFNTTCEPVRLARRNHMNWELSNAIDPRKDWSRYTKRRL